MTPRMARLIAPEPTVIRAAIPATEKHDKVAEKAIHKELWNWLCLHDIKALHFPMHKKAPVVGWPDFTFPCKGKYVFAEIKVGNNKATPEQQRCMDALRDNGAVGGVFYSFEDVAKFVRDL